MKAARLTRHEVAANSPDMEHTGQWRTGGTKRPNRRAWGAAGALVAGAAAMGLSGCISVNAPDKPIVIELNINIKQEVVYRLAADAAKTIDENPDIF